jgi:hypothetical protein
MRENPQVLALLLICLVLGIGTFLLVVFGLLPSGSTTTSGESSGWRLPAPAVVVQASVVAPRGAAWPDLAVPTRG